MATQILVLLLWLLAPAQAPAQAKAKAWTAAQLAAADTGHWITYLTKEEKLTIQHLNLCRLFPRDFARLEVAPLCQGCHPAGSGGAAVDPLPGPDKRAGHAQAHSGPGVSPGTLRRCQMLRGRNSQSIAGDAPAENVQRPDVCRMPVVRQRGRQRNCHAAAPGCWGGVVGTPEDLPG